MNGNPTTTNQKGEATLGNIFWTAVVLVVFLGASVYSFLNIGWTPQSPEAPQTQREENLVDLVTLTARGLIVASVLGALLLTLLLISVARQYKAATK